MAETGCTSCGSTGLRLTEGRCDGCYERTAHGGTPRKQDELDLWAAVGAGETPRQAGERLGVPAKRVEYLCGKWADRGIYEYGVSLDLGWPTPATSGRYEPGADRG